jgi:alanine dehydrogenase
VGAAREAATDADVVVTATTATSPVFPGEALAEHAVVIAVGAYAPAMRELDAVTVSRAGRVYADVPSEAAATGDVAPTSLTVDDLVPLGSLFDGGTRTAGISVVESVGTAVLDAAAGEHVLGVAEDADVGTECSLE